MGRLRRGERRKIGPAACSEVVRERKAHKRATEAWHELMQRSGVAPSTVTTADVDTLPRRIGPARVPMGGSPLGDA